MWFFDEISVLTLQIMLKSQLDHKVSLIATLYKYQNSRSQTRARIGEISRTWQLTARSNSGSKFQTESINWSQSIEQFHPQMPIASKIERIMMTI